MALPGSAAFQSQCFLRDTVAGLIVGVMAILLSIGIVTMSDYPIRVGLATIAFVCLVGWINAWFKPGNSIGALGIAAGLAYVTHHGPYVLMLAFLVVVKVYQVGITEGLLVTMVVHGIVHYIFYTKHENVPGKAVVKRYFDNLKKDSDSRIDCKKYIFIFQSWLQ